MSTLLVDNLPLVIPAGYGFHPAPCRNFPEDLFNRLLVWEAPRSDQLYVASVDVGDGIGQNRSVVDVTRVGTLKEPEEQVAQWISAWTDPIALAPVVDAVGRLYKGSDNLEAVCAIECNNHGLVTQSELQHHIGYSNLFVWEYLDAVDPARGQSTRFGWWTTPRTRPLILVRYLKKLKAVDPATGMPDYRINSPHTIEELRSFQTAGGIREAEADPTQEGAYDDCIMAGAIGVWVCGRIQMGESEPMDAARRRLNEEKQRREAVDTRASEGRDYINQDFTVEEAGFTDPLAVEDPPDDYYSY